MKTYKIKSSAVRAAKKEMGEDWMAIASIIPVGEEFAIELKSTASIKASVDAVQLLADQAQADSDKAAKKAEIESRKPAHIPKAPITSIVASESAPIPKPSLPAFLKIASQADGPVAEIKVHGPESEEFLAAAQALADKQANAAAVNIEPLRPRLSTAEKPTKKVWHVADSMPGAKRKDVIEECVRQGIAYGTARTQYQHWFKCLNDSKAAPIATIGADGKITMPTKA